VAVRVCRDDAAAYRTVRLEVRVCRIDGAYYRCRASATRGAWSAHDSGRCMCRSYKAAIYSLARL
jgi:hypothetical protein